MDTFHSLGTKIMPFLRLCDSISEGFEPCLYRFTDSGKISVTFILPIFIWLGQESYADITESLVIDEWQSLQKL